MPSEQIQRVVNAPSLPSLPAIATEVLEMTRDPNVSIKAIAQSVQNDPALAARILKTVNSSFYGLSTPCQSIARAMSYLGLNTVKSLVLGFSLADAFLESDDDDCDDEKDSGFCLIEHWRGALFAATAAREFASSLAPSIDADNAFIAALLQDVGMLACAHVLGDEYAKVVENCLPGDPSLTQRERETLGFTHVEVGVELADKWRLPEVYGAAIRYQNRAEQCPEEHADVVRCVEIATLASAALLAREDQKPEAIARRAATKAKRDFQVEEDTCAKWFENVRSLATELAGLFKLPRGTPANTGLLQAAQEQLLVHQIDQQRQQDELLHAALTDGLTGVANRKRFDMALEDAFSEATTGDTDLALMVLDADKFKSVNDTHGHQAGDAVLIQLAERITQAVGDAGLVARFGGEEFTVILPGSRLDRAGAIAERVRRMIEATPFDLADVPCDVDELRVTASVGVCGRDGGSNISIKHAATLLRGADKAVYAAKEAGRNNVKMLRLSAQRKAEGTAQAPSPGPATPPLPATQQPTTVMPTPKPAMTPATPPAATTPATGPQDAPGVPTRVLLVEDDRLQAKLVTKPLESAPNFEVTVAANAKDALAMLTDPKAPPFGLVLCDLGLPDILGNELVERIRALAGYESTPIVMLSASEAPKDIAACLAAGANAFITKESIYDDPKRRVIQLAEFWSGLSEDADADMPRCAAA